MGSVLMEDNQHKLLAPVSKSPVKATSSCINLDSISVDIGSAHVRIETLESCNHFTLRGYVAEVRRRDKKLCFPFCADDHGAYDRYNESLVTSYDLPPLDVPKFRWWQCRGCLRGSGSQNSGEVFNLQNGIINCAATSSQRSVVDTGTLFPSKGNDKTSSQLKPGRERQKLKPAPAPAPSSFSRDDNHCRPHPRGKALDYGLDKNSCQETPPSTPDGVRLDILLQVVARRSQLNDISASPVPMGGSRGVVAEPGFSGHKNRDLADDKCHSTVLASDDDPNRNLPTTRVDADVAQLTGDAVSDRLVPLPLPDLNVFDHIGPVENDEQILVINPCDDTDDEDDLSGSSRPKIRKTRLLSELSGVNDFRNVDHVSRGGVSLVGSYDISVDKGLSFNDHGQAHTNERGSPHVTELKRRRRSRRISCNDEAYRPLEIKRPGEGTKRLRTASLDKENTLESSEDSDTESEEHASAGVVSQSTVKGSYSLVRNHALQNKVKKARGENEASSMSSRQKAATKVCVGKTMSAEKSPTAGDGRQRMDQFVESHVIVQQMEKSPTTTVEKKVQRTIKDQSLLTPGKILAPPECSSVNYGEIQPRMDITAGKAATHFPNTSLSVKNDMVHLYPNGDRPCLLSALQGLKIVDDDPLVSKVPDTGDSHPRTDFTAAALAPPFSIRFEVDRVKSTNIKSTSKGKEKMFPEFGTNGLLHSENVVSHDIKKKDVTAKQNIDINCMPVDDNVPQQRHSDDVPMDIVELMAKHQHERQGSFEKDKDFVLPRSFYAKNAWPFDGSLTSILNGLRPVERSNLSQDNFPCEQRPLVSSARSGTFAGFCDPLPVKQKFSVGQFPEVKQIYLNGTHPKYTHSSGRFDGSARHNGRTSSELRLSSPSLTSHNCSGRTAAQSLLHGSVQNLEGLNRCPSPSQQNPRNHVWSPVMPKYVTQGPGNAETVPHPSGKQKVHQDHGKLNLDRFSLWKQRSNPELQAQYSSAMQLLKMMHSGETRPPTGTYNTTTESNPEFLRWPALHPDQRYNQHAVGRNLRNPSLNDGRNSFPQNLTHPCFSGTPNAGPFASPFQNDQATAGRSPVIRDHISFASRAQTKAINSRMSAYGGNLNWYPMQKTTKWDEGRKVVSPTGMGKGIIDVSSPAIPVLNSPKDMVIQKQSETRVTLPTPQTEVCLVNKNPAELDLNLARKYMIEGEKLRPLRWCEENSSRAKATAKRAERMQHLSASKERERHRKS